MAIAILTLILITGFIYSWLSKRAARERLNQLYIQGLRPIMNRDNTYYPQGLLKDLDSVLIMRYQSPGSLLGVQYERARVYLNLGDEKKAITLLDTILVRTEAHQQDPLAKGARAELALAYLRLGERNNCISGHCSGSCIFPIRERVIFGFIRLAEEHRDIQGLVKGQPRDLVSRWLLNLAYMTLGDYPEKVPSEWLIPGLDTDTSAYKLKAFQDMAGDLGLNATKNMAGGTIVDDFNNDGYLDIVTSCWDLEGAMHYYRNNGNGTFTDVSKESGLSEIKGGLNIIQADYNNDGYTDILVLRGPGWQNSANNPVLCCGITATVPLRMFTIESGILSFPSHPGGRLGGFQ